MKRLFFKSFMYAGLILGIVSLTILLAINISAAEQGDTDGDDNQWADSFIEPQDGNQDNSPTNTGKNDVNGGNPPTHDLGEPSDESLSEAPDNISDSSSDETDLDDPSLDQDNEDLESSMPALYIRAINPGYKINGITNVGEMIELARVDNPDTPISLAGIAVGYTNSSGNQSILIEFPENSWMTGENLLLRLASSPGSELANLTYSKTLAMNAGINLSVNGEVIDEACWTGKNDCQKAFTTANPTTLFRNQETGEFEHRLIYQPDYHPENYYLIDESTPDDTEASLPIPSHCQGLQFSEILSYYETTKSEQFIEFHNTSSAPITLDGCKIRYKNKNHLLSGQVNPDEYLAYYPIAFSLTKNPTSSNQVEIIDTNNTVVDSMEYPNGQRKSTSYAWLGHDDKGQEIWKTTYAPTPGAPNHYQEFRSCEAGKVINEATGNCVKVSSISEKVCQAGYYLNILTGRCKKIATTTTKTCKEGYFLNPETNRCRKIKENNGADYQLTPETYNEESSFIALYAVFGVLGLGLVYLTWEYRHQIAKVWRRLLGRK